MGKRIGTLIIGLLIIVAGGWAIVRFWPTEAAAEPPADSVAQTDAATAPTVGAEGVLVPVRYERLSLTGGGRIATVLVAEGDTVAAGDPLLQLETDTLQAALAQTDAAVAQAEAALEEARAARELAVAQQTGSDEALAAAEAARAAAAANLALVLDDPPNEELLADTNRTAAEAGVAEAEAAVAAAEAAQAQAAAAITRAEAGVTRAAAALDQAQAARSGAAETLDQATLRAPAAGTVVALDARVGEFAPPGSPLVTVADLSGWEVETSDLIELDVVAFEVGAPAVVTLDALPDTPLQATVAAIGQTPTIVRGDTTYVVTLTLADAGNLPLRWGMTAFVEIDAAP